MNGIRKDELNLVRNEIETTRNPTKEMQSVDKEEVVLDVYATATPSHGAVKKSTSLITPNNNESCHYKVVPSAAKTNGGGRSPSADVGKILSVDVSVQNKSFDSAMLEPEEPVSVQIRKQIDTLLFALADKCKESIDEPSITMEHLAHTTISKRRDKKTGSASLQLFDSIE